MLQALVFGAVLVGTIQEPVEIGALVGQLSSVEPEARERADRELRRIGEPALGALREASRASDAALAARARRMIAEIHEARPAAAPPRVEIQGPAYVVWIEGEQVTVREKATGKLMRGETVEACSPADMAGLLPYDVVVETDGTTVGTVGRFRRTVQRALAAGCGLDLTLIRKGERMTVEVAGR
jgi:hypothetical protein